MKRFWILFATEFKAWRRDPITALGGFIPPTIMLIAFGLLFGGRLGLPVAVLNQDIGPQGDILAQTIRELPSPFGHPYYTVSDMAKVKAWEAYQSHRIDGIWVIPADFSQRLAAGQNPTVEMHFSNYSDDRAKNHRIYAAEVLWDFYHQIGQPAPPLELAETYPRSEMVGWFPIIAVGSVLLSVTLGAIFNIFALTYKEQTLRITIEFGMAPRAIAWILLPKVLLALIMGLASGTAFLGILYLLFGVWPGQNIWAVGLLAGLASLFWIAFALVVGLRARHYLAGAIAAVLGAITAFFICGGLNLVRGRELTWYSQLLPNAYVVDPLRDLILFDTWPADWNTVLPTVLLFALGSQIAVWLYASRKIRRLD